MISVPEEEDERNVKEMSFEKVKYETIPELKKDISP